MIIIDGKKISDDLLASIKKEVELLPFVPLFCDVLVGSDGASAQYVRMKAKKAESVGIKFHSANFPESITTDELVQEIKILNKMENMCGIIVQLPLPESLDRKAVLDAIDFHLDVDCLGETASENFYKGGGSLGFPTALSCMAILDTLKLDLSDKKIVVLGQGQLVGKPVTALLRFRGLTPVIITSKTENKEALIKEADIVISGMGKGKYITGAMIKEGAVLIDAGTSESTSGIVGDIDSESVKEMASFISPVPGGVGPVTVAMLLSNVLKVAQAKAKQNE